MSKQRRVAIAIKDLSKSLTREYIAKIQCSLELPEFIIERVNKSSYYGIEFLLQLKSWDGFQPQKFMYIIEEINDQDLITPAKKIPWLHPIASKSVPEMKTATTFMKLLRKVPLRDWNLILTSYDISDCYDMGDVLGYCVDEGIITKDLSLLCKLMKSIQQSEKMIEEIQEYNIIFEQFSEEEFENLLYSVINVYEEENQIEWIEKLRAYMLSRNKDVNIILDKETISLTSVYTPLTVIKHNSTKSQSEEGTTVKEIEFLREMSKEVFEIVDFELHLTRCRAKRPEVWTLVGNPGCGKTFLCNYAGYYYGIDKMEMHQYLLTIPCRDPEWHAIEVARQDDNEINKFIRRWLRIALPLDAGWAEQLVKYLMNSGGENLLLIIDGLDEFIKTVPFHTTLLYLLLQKRILSNATVLLTSRPGAWSDISSQYKNEFKINTHFQVLGFSPRNRDSYFEKRMRNVSKLDETRKLFRRHNELNLLALVPVNASLFSSLFNDTEDILAQTLTDVYQELITYMIRRQMSRMELREYTKVLQIEHFAPEIQECINIIGEEAYKGIYDRELICKDDITLCIGGKEYQCERLGLMQEEIIIAKLGGRMKLWNFAHLTLQEFVSAIWLSNQIWTNQCIISRYLTSTTHVFYMFKMVMRFLSGHLSDRARVILTILFNRLLHNTLPIHNLPMYYQLTYDFHRIVNVSNWKEFTKEFLLLISIIFESKQYFLLPDHFIKLLPTPLHLYFVSTVSPNEWYTFMLSLAYLPHIHMIFINLVCITTDLFEYFLSQIDKCRLTNLALIFTKQSSSEILSYTRIISSVRLPPTINISIELYECSTTTTDVLFPRLTDQFSGSLAIHRTSLSKQNIWNLVNTFHSIHNFYYGQTTDSRDWLIKDFIASHNPQNGLFIIEQLDHPLYISPEIISQISSLQEIHMRTRDSCTILPYLHAFSNLTYLSLDSYSKPTYNESYRNSLTQTILRNSNTLRGLVLSDLEAMGFDTWESILTPIQRCNNLIELRIFDFNPNDISYWSTAIDSLQSLIYLRLEQIPLQPKEMYILCDSLAYHPIIRGLTIVSCNLNSTACKHLNYLIKSLPKLMRLDISRNLEIRAPDHNQLILLKETAAKYAVDVVYLGLT